MDKYDQSRSKKQMRNRDQREVSVENSDDLEYGGRHQTKQASAARGQLKSNAGSSHKQRSGRSDARNEHYVNGGNDNYHTATGGGPNDPFVDNLNVPSKSKRSERGNYKNKDQDEEMSERPVRDQYIKGFDKVMQTKTSAAATAMPFDGLLSSSRQRVNKQALAADSKRREQKHSSEDEAEDGYRNQEYLDVVDPQSRKPKRKERDDVGGKSRSGAKKRSERGGDEEQYRHEGAVSYAGFSRQTPSDDGERVQKSVRSQRRK